MVLLLLLLLATLLLLWQPIPPLLLLSLLLLLELGLHLTALILCAWSRDFFFPDWCCCQAMSTIHSMLAGVGRGPSSFSFSLPFTEEGIILVGVLILSICVKMSMYRGNFASARRDWRVEGMLHW